MFRGVFKMKSFKYTAGHSVSNEYIKSGILVWSKRVWFRRNELIKEERASNVFGALALTWEHFNISNSVFFCKID